MALTHRLRVRYNECDAQGIVFNANYLVFADVASNELWRDGLGGYEAFTASGLDVVVAEANLRWRSSARFDEELDVVVTIDHVGRTSMTWRNAMTIGGREVATVLVRYVCITVADGRPAPIPDDMRARLDAHLTDPAVLAS